MAQYLKTHRRSTPTNPPAGHYQVEFPPEVDPLQYDGKLVECTFDRNRGIWVFMRERRDKDTPNASRVYLRVGRPRAPCTGSGGWAPTRVKRSGGCGAGQRCGHGPWGDTTDTLIVARPHICR